MTAKRAKKKPVRSASLVRANKPVVVIVDEREVKAIPIPRTKMEQVYDFFAGLVK